MKRLQDYLLPQPFPFRLTGKADLIKHKSVWVHIAAWDNRGFLVENTFRKNNNNKFRMFNLQCSATENYLPLSILTDTIKPLWGRKLIRRQHRKISKDWIWVPPLNWLLYCLSSLSYCCGMLFSNFWYAKICSTYCISIMLMQHFCLYLGKSSNIYIFPLYLF